jgi:hypothetical protein
MSIVSDKSTPIQDSLNKLDFKIDKLQKESNQLDRNLEYYNKNINRCNKRIETSNNSSILNDLNTANKGLNKTETRKQEVVDELARLHQERTSLIMSNPEKHTFRTLPSKKSPPRKSAKVSPTTPPRSIFTKMSRSIKSVINPNGGGKGGKRTKRSKKQTMKKYKY